MSTPRKPGSNKKTTATKPPKPPSSSKEKKNLVVVARRPPKSPAPPSSAHKDSDSESVLSQVSSASSVRAALPIFTQKQLAQDIEEAGGIKVFKNSKQPLSILCNNNEDVYGKRGDPIRAKITKKVVIWKAFSEAEYVDKVLNRLRVKSAATLEFQSRSANKAKYEKKISLQQFSDNDSSSDESGDEGDSIASSESIPRRILFTNEERANPIESPTMQAPPPSQSAAIPMGSGKFLSIFVINQC
jgi:hypothetical protein